MWFPGISEFSSTANLKWPVTAAFSNFSDALWTGNIWYVFRGETPLLNFSGEVQMWRGPKREFQVQINQLWLVLACVQPAPPLKKIGEGRGQLYTDLTGFRAQNLQNTERTVFCPVEHLELTKSQETKIKTEQTVDSSTLVSTTLAPVISNCLSCMRRRSKVL